MNVSLIWDKVSVTFRYSRKQTPLIPALSLCSGSHRLLGTWKQGSVSPPLFFISLTHTQSHSVIHTLITDLKKLNHRIASLKLTLCRLDTADVEDENAIQTKDKELNVNSSLNLNIICIGMICIAYIFERRIELLYFNGLIAAVVNA